jgi:hypothetical protein
MTQYKIISSSGVQEITGSIAKLYCVSAGSIASSSWGLFTYPESKWTPVNTIDHIIPVSGGATIEGPLGKVKIASGNFLVYIEG